MQRRRSYIFKLEGRGVGNRRCRWRCQGWIQTQKRRFSSEQFSVEMVSDTKKCTNHLLPLYYSLADDSDLGVTTLMAAVPSNLSKALDLDKQIPVECWNFYAVVFKLSLKHDRSAISGDILIMSISS